MQFYKIKFKINRKIITFEKKFMKKLILPLTIVAIIVALWEQSKTDKNVYIMAVAIVIFMLGLMRLSAKTPSKNPENEDENV
jgi:glycerol uptake facilitator-like aquaporin